jgi:hypothetical protein
MSDKTVVTGNGIATLGALAPTAFSMTSMQPVNGIFSATAGTLAAGTYTYQVTALTAIGESRPSTATNITLGSTGGVIVTWSRVIGATGYRVYGRVAGLLSERFQVSDPKTTTWTDDGTAGAIGGSPPVSDTTSWAIMSPAFGCTQLGLGAYASGLNSTVFGYNASADDNSCAFGYGATAQNLGVGPSYAVGYNAQATSGNSIALGANATADSGSIAIGYAATSSGGGIAIGYGAIAYGGIAIGMNANATAGNGIALGFGATASAGVAIGAYSATSRWGELNHSADLSSPMHHGWGSVSWFGTTVNATLTELFLDGSSSRCIVAAASAFHFDMLVVAYDNADGVAAGWNIVGCINRDGTLTLSSTATEVFSTNPASTAAWNVVVSADNTNNSLEVQVQGAASTTIKWCARAELSELRF